MSAHIHTYEYIHTHVHTYMHIHARIFIFADTHVHTQGFVFVALCMCRLFVNELMHVVSMLLINAPIQVHLNTEHKDAYIQSHVHVYMRVCVCVCQCVVDDSECTPCMHPCKRSWCSHKCFAYVFTFRHIYIVSANMHTHSSMYPFMHYLMLGCACDTCMYFWMYEWLGICTHTHMHVHVFVHLPLLIYKHHAYAYMQLLMRFGACLINVHVWKQHH